VLEVAPDVLRHRLVLSYDAVADQVPVDHLVSRILQTVPLPQVSARPGAQQPAPSAPPVMSPSTPPMPPPGGPA
jgi:MoxR-like ATPase